MNLIVEPQNTTVLTTPDTSKIIRVSRREAVIETVSANPNLLKSETPVRFVHSDIHAIIVRIPEEIDGGVL